METTVETLFIKGLSPAQRETTRMLAGTASAAVREECRGSRLYKCHWKENHFLNDMKPDKAKKRRERECTLWKFSLFSAKWNAHLFFGPLLSINLHHSLQSFFTKKVLMLFAMMYLFTYYSVFLQWVKKNGETFFPLFPQYFCVSSFHNT